ncbi:MAG: hypothetical protein HY926_02455, partial [Elusimicrobia bacterium]|nr:hypothetical protein [Elusimicrobiota bacterium]
HNETYWVVARSSDLAGNVQTAFNVNTDSKTVVFDLQAATAAVNNFALVAGASYYNMYVTSFTGTATDAPAGVGSLRIAVSSSPSGVNNSWWNGTDFSGLDAASTYMSTSSYAAGAWSRDFAAGFPRMNNGLTYKVQVLALDKAAPFNSQAWQYNFYYDSAAPTAYIGTPVSGSYINGPITITGTAADVVAAAYSDLANVRVSIQELSGAGASGLCFDGAAAFDQTCPNFLATGGAPASWNYTPPGNPYGTGRTYLVVSSATDRANNRQVGALVGQSSNTFIYNTTVPETKFVVPNGAGYQSNLTQVTGTAIGSNGVPLAYVQVRISDLSQSGKYWDDSAQGFNNIAGEAAWYGSSATASDWTVWHATFGFESWPAHQLRFEVRARDQAGNFDTSVDTVTFFYDNLVPESYPSGPANGSFISSLPGDQLSGTASDLNSTPPASGVSSVNMAIRRNSTGLWWNGVDFNGNGPPASFAYNTTAPADPWVATIVGLGAKMASLPSGASYYMTSVAQDGAGNVEAWFNARGSTFTFDTGRPTAGITYPALPNVKLLDTLSGTASDDIAGVDDIKVSVHDETQGPAAGWWRYPQNDFNGGAIQWVSASTGATGVLTATWTFALANLNSGHSYRIMSQASDKSGLVQNTYGVGVSSMVVIYDTTTPNSTVQVPVDLANRSAIASVSGVSADPVSPLASGVKEVGLRIIDQGLDYAWNTADDRYWSGPGSGWQVNSTSVTASGTLAWSYNTLPSWDSNHRYRIVSTAYDFAGMVDAFSSTSTVIYDTAAPVSYVTRPEEDTGYGGGNPLTTISGTADDRYGIPLMPAAGIASVQLSIREDNPPLGDVSDTNDKIWTGVGGGVCPALDSGWCPVTGAGQEVLLSTGTSPWTSWEYVAPNWTTGKNYVIRTVAADAAAPAANVEGDNFRHFSVDNAAPTSYIAIPTSGGAYRTLPQLTGTAQDDTSGVRQVMVCIKLFPASTGVEQTVGCQAAAGEAIWKQGQGWDVSGTSWARTNALPTTDGVSWSTWTFDSSGIGLPNTGKGRIMTMSMDNMGLPGPGNQENGVPPSDGYTGHVFSMDNFPPVASIGVPADGAGYNAAGLAAGLSGTATDWSGDGAGGNPAPGYPGSSLNAADTGLPAAGGVRIAISSAPNFNTWWTGGGWNPSVNPLWVSQTFVGLTSGTWAWTAGLPGWVSTRYRVLAKGIDNAANDQYVDGALIPGISSNTFSYDNTAPISTITWPTHGTAKNAVPVIYGTTSDDFSGITGGGEVYLRISSYTLADSSTYYWTGAAGAWSLTPTDLTANFVGVSSGTWSYTDASLPGAWVSGRVYTLFVHSKDKSNNFEVAGATVSFLFDQATTLPAITAPTAGGPFYGPFKTLPSLLGSASDLPAHAWAGLAAVHVRIRNTFGAGDQYWNRVQDQWTTTVETWNTADSTASWSHPQPDNPGWLDGVQYELNVRSSDTASNVSQASTRTFVWDSSTPTVVMQMPNAQYHTAPLSIISGTAKDPGGLGTFSDLKPVEISIQINPPALTYWNGDGTNFSDPGETFHPVTMGVYDAGNKWWPWSITGTTPTWVDGTQYRVRARATDNVDNVSTLLGDQTFTYNKVPPVTKFPASFVDGQQQNASLTTISGTAQGSSGVGLSIVQLRVLNTDLGWYWDNWGTFSGGAPGFNASMTADLAWYPASATVSDWTQWKTTTSFLVDKQNFRIEARSRDLAGNYDISSDTRTFLYDMAPPQTFVSSPAYSTIVSTLAMASLTGTAWDGPGSVSGVASVSVAVKSLATGQWWNGIDGFNAASPPGLFYPTAWAGPTWTYPSQNLLNALKLASGASYYITARAVDYAANTEAFFNANGSTFTFDNAPPASGIAFPLDASFSSHTVLVARGGSSDDVGVSTIALKVQDVQPGFGSCYMPGLGFGQSCDTSWFPAQGSTSAWTFTFPAGLWTQGHAYVIRSSATDQALPGNAQVALSSAGFKYDIVVPTVVKTTPDYIRASVGFITGTSTDSPAGIGSLGFALWSVTDNGWWTGSGFTAGSPIYFGTATYNVGNPDDWSWDFGAIPVVDGRHYVLASSATDKGGVRRVQNPLGDMWIDNSEPTAGIDLPVDGSFYNSMGVISGTSSDNVFMATVTLVVQDLGPAPNGCYQPGAGFGAGCAEFPAQGAPCAGPNCNWSFTGIP